MTPAVDDGAEPATERDALGAVEPGGRFVEQHELRAARECARDADELALSLRELGRPGRGDVGEPEQVERVLDGGFAVPARGEQVSQRPPPGAAIRRGAEVLAHGEVVEQLDGLERADQSEPRPAMRRHAPQVASVEHHPALRLREVARQRVDARRLAGAVRSDEPHQRARFHA